MSVTGSSQRLLPCPSAHGSLESLDAAPGWEGSTSTPPSSLPLSSCPSGQEVAYPESLLEANLRVPLGLCCLESRTMLFLAAFCACASPHIKPMGVQEALALG